MAKLDPIGVQDVDDARYDNESTGLIESSVLYSVNPRDSLLHPTVARPRYNRLFSKRHRK